IEFQNNERAGAGVSMTAPLGTISRPLYLAMHRGRGEIYGIHARAYDGEPTVDSKPITRRSRMGLLHNIRIGAAELPQAIRGQGHVTVLCKSHDLRDEFGMDEAHEVLTQDRRRMLCIAPAIMDVPPQKASPIGTPQHLEHRGVGL